MSHVIADRYAQAIFELSREHRKLEQVYNDFHHIGEFIDQSQEFRDFLNNASLSMDDQEAIFKNAFQTQLDPTTFIALLFLLQKERINLLRDICTSFEHLYHHEKNVTKVKVTTSMPLSQQHVSLLKQHLKLKLRKEIKTDLNVDKTIIGGIKLQIGDTIHDLSIKSQLDKFKYEMIHS